MGYEMHREDGGITKSACDMFGSDVDGLVSNKRAEGSGPSDRARSKQSQVTAPSNKAIQGVMSNGKSMTRRTRFSSTFDISPSATFLFHSQSNRAQASTPHLDRQTSILNLPGK